jgi:YidC/Oxa1 family membrane protein insertase
MSLINTFFFDPFLNLLILLFTLFGGNMGFAIIGVTILFRLIVLPLNWKSLHSQRKMQQLKPHLDGLKDKHGNDKAALAQAQMDLYKEHGVSPVGGCLPMLLQLPFLFGVYAAMRFVVDLKNVADLNGRLYVNWLHIHKLADLHLQFGWINLAHPDPLFILPLLAALTQFLVSKMTLPPQAPAVVGNKKEASLEQSMLSAQRQMVYFFPIMTFLVAWRFPSGLSLYWTVGNLFSIIQQFYINRALPHPALQIIPAEAPTLPAAAKPSTKKKTAKKTVAKKTKKGTQA